MQILINLVHHRRNHASVSATEKLKTKVETELIKSSQIPELYAHKYMNTNLITSTHHHISDDPNMDSARLIKYTHAARRKYLKILGELPWDEVVKDRGASYPSIRDIFLHALDAEDLLINYIVQGKNEKRVSQDYGKFQNIHQIEERVDEVEKKVDAYLKTLTESELDRKVALPWRPSFPLRVDDILITVAIEDACHMGELIALMWQFDKEPPYLGWSAFVEQNP